MSKSFKKLVKSQLSEDYGFPSGVEEYSYENVLELAEVGMYVTFFESGSLTTEAKTDYWITKDSKGKSETVTNVKYRNREVVMGYLPKKVADNLWEELIETNLIVILESKHDYSDGDAESDDDSDDDSSASDKFSQYNIDICSITYTWNNKTYTETPKSYHVNYDPITVGATDDIKLSDKAKKRIKYVLIIDPQWGRKGYLLKKVKKALKRLNK